ncbi:MAG TPA: alpha/beta hydrolase, partial [Candidatus Omnitrophica bacterium]|nr:alpha/beta hydrolase [Candidatus Omnitrophota bacterium]
MIKFLLFLIILVLSLAAYAKYIERTNVFFPSEEIEATPEILNLDYEDIYIDTEDSVKINGWFIPNDKAEYTLLFFHGNGGNISN